MDKHRQTQIAIARIANIILVALLTLMPVASSLQAAPNRYIAADNDLPEIGYHLVDLPTQIQTAINTYFVSHRGDFPKGEKLAIVSARVDLDWAIVTIAVTDPEHESVGMLDAGSLIVLNRNTKDQWQATTEKSPAFQQTIQSAPDSFLDASTKRLLIDDDQRVPLQPEATMKFPWDSGQSWKMTQGWHSGNNIDIAPSSGESNKWVLAAHGGVVNRICNGEASANVEVKNSDGTRTTYVHLDKNSISSSMLGTTISQGTELGKLFQGSYNPGSCGSWYCQLRDSCGISTGPHLHFGTPSQQVTVDGWTSSSNNNWQNGSETKSPGSWFNSSNVRGGAPTPPSCPSSGNVILYKDWNYDCGGEGDGSGYVKRDSTGFQNMPGGFNDRASSIRIKSGWSVKLFEKNDRGGGGVCRTGDDNNFAGDRFDNGVGLNDQVSSFEVFSDNRCGVPPPPCPQPGLNSPANGAEYDNGDNISFSWNSVSCEFSGYTFRVRTTTNMETNGPGQTVIDVGVGGTNRTTSFDSRWFYQDLYWSVRAANAPGGASWAPARRFRISPDKLPTVNFNTSNGNTANLIESRDQNWTFQGNASDPENRLNRVEFRCSGDNCGSGDSVSYSSNWSITRSGMTGKNDIYFRAYDGKPQSADSRHLDLRIDLAAPTTQINLNGQADSWPTWFTNEVQVRLSAQDGNTGGARVGVKEVHYKVDGGSWQTQSGDTVNVSVGSDGSHTVQYYAIDKVGNQETTRSATFKIDRTPPSSPAGATESSNVVSGQWQKAKNAPSFAWPAANDNLSGVGGYQLYFGQDTNGVIGHKEIPASDNRVWTPNPGGVTTGTYYLRGRTADKAGNWSAWVTMFTFRYDGTPPKNPGQAAHAAGVTSDAWQKITAQANFSWPGATDEGSGIKGYLSYWGADPAGTSPNFITANSFQASALCQTSQACTSYLRLRSTDNVDLQAEDWSTTFVLRYDGAPPVADFTFNGGVTQTNQTQLTLNLTATDQGSGLREMRLSSDGNSWTPWEVYANQRVWEIPGISRQSWPIYLQVRDAVGWESQVVSKTIYFDVNVDQPHSDNFRLFNSVMSAGAGAHQSTTYKGRSTVGQVPDSARITSQGYILWGGYEAGSQAIPLVKPGHDEFEYINGIFASGVVNTTMQSGQYQMIGTWGEPGLPNNRTTISSAGYQLQPGFLAARPSPKETPTPTPTPTPGPTPTPTPTPACEFPRVSVNDGAIYTGNTNVTLKLCAPKVTQMMVSNDGGFGGAQWESYAESKAWTITTLGQYVVPRFVYVAFKDAKGVIYSTYMDDIIYDPTEPSGNIRVGDSVPQDFLDPGGLLAAASTADVFTAGGVTYVRRLGNTVLAEPVVVAPTKADGSVDLYLSARDDVSGIAQMRLNPTDASGSGSWEEYSAVKSWQPDSGDGIYTIAAQFQDDAGNTSQVVTKTFVIDTMPPVGSIYSSIRVAGPDTISTTLYLGGGDYLTEIAGMRIASEPTFSSSVWQPFESPITWPVSVTQNGTASLYVQYRDIAGNISEVYSDTYRMDLTSPIVDYVGVDSAETLTRTLHIYAWDEESAVTKMYLSNDPLMVEGVTTSPYIETTTWTFDDRYMVWVQAEDSVGNLSQPYPAYAEHLPPPPTPTPTPTLTPTGTVQPPTPTPSATPTPTATPGEVQYFQYIPLVLK